MSLEPLALRPFPRLRLLSRFTPIVVQKRIEVVPSTPPKRDRFVDISVGQLAGPSTPEIMERQESPTALTSLIDEFPSSCLNPVPKRSRRTIDQDLIGADTTEARCGVDGICE